MTHSLKVTDDAMLMFQVLEHAINPLNCLAMAGKPLNKGAFGRCGPPAQGALWPTWP